MTVVMIVLIAIPYFAALSLACWLQYRSLSLYILTPGKIIEAAIRQVEERKR